MINFNADYFNNCVKVTVRNTLPDVEKNSVENDIFWKVSTFKANHRIFQLLNWPIITQTDNFATELKSHVLMSQIRQSISSSHSVIE